MSRPTLGEVARAAYSEYFDKDLSGDVFDFVAQAVINASGLRQPLAAENAKLRELLDRVRFDVDVELSRLDFRTLAFAEQLDEKLRGES